MSIPPPYNSRHDTPVCNGLQGALRAPPVAAGPDRAASEVSSLFTAATLDGLHLRNRLAVAPMSRVSAGTGGVPTARMASYYAEFARGGFGLVITEGIYTDEYHSRAYHRQPGLAHAAQGRQWRAVTRAVRDEGGRIFAQLMHAGALSQALRDTVAPSAVEPLGRMLRYYGGEGPFPTPRALHSDELPAIADGFAAAAVHAADAGFDGVEIHGANGYLIDQFLTGYTNQRTDRFGGPITHRTGFVALVIEAVRDAVGPQFPVGVRLSQTKVNDPDHRWPGGRDDAVAIFTAVRDAGASYLHIARGTRDPDTTATFGTTSVTRLAAQTTGLPIIANGGLGDPRVANRVVADGDADLVSLARAALANPDWPRRVRAGRDLVAYDRAMISPAATIENTDRWRTAGGRHQS